MSARSGDEIMSVLDEAQANLDPEEFDLYDLVWEILASVLEIVSINDPTNNKEIRAAVSDFVVNQYGD